MRERLMEGVAAIFQRKPSALMPLDGLRAIAVLWVIILHTLLNNAPVFSDCFLNSFSETSWWVEPIGRGDYGVDIFFVLSGFLIGYILFKEQDKYDGKVDAINFWRSRFLRIWPALLLKVIVYVTLSATFSPWKDNRSPQWPLNDFMQLIFLNNFIDLNGMDHTWSIAVEFQFYLISPFLVYLFSKIRRPWLIPLIILLISTICNGITNLTACPDFFKLDFLMWSQECHQSYMNTVYVRTYNRMTPYGFGMYAAFIHLR